MFEELKRRLRRHEGVIPFMYLDGLGYVTTGVGHKLSMVADAQGMAFLEPSGVPASAAAIAVEYTIVKGLEPNHAPWYYSLQTRLRLPAAAIDALLDYDVTAMHAGSRALIPGFDMFPESAQEALLDMAFQLGPHGLVKKFPHMMAAVSRRDWSTCAAECEREGIQAWRNKATADLFLQAAGPLNT